jgi:hypothetical protein
MLLIYGLKKKLAVFEDAYLPRLLCTHCVRSEASPLKSCAEHHWLLVQR